MDRTQQAHQRWRQRVIDWHEVQLKAERDSVPYCESCGCVGNEKCGHKALYGSCELTQSLICRCCAGD